VLVCSLNTSTETATFGALEGAPIQQYSHQDKTDSSLHFIHNKAKIKMKANKKDRCLLVPSSEITNNDIILGREVPPLRIKAIFGESNGICYLLRMAVLGAVYSLLAKVT